MQLIAESGSTKTNWKGTKSGKTVLTFTTAGLNPYVQTREDICDTIKSDVMPNVGTESVQQIYFYGAGCSNEENNKIMYSCLKNFFHQAQIEIEHDLLGAARGLWGNQEGIVCILGTGSNSCIYDGNDIIQGIPALGYVLGDEGSGSYMGKNLVRDYLYQQMPVALAEKLRLEYKLDKDRILNKVYKQPNPNRWLASFSIFIRENFNFEYCQGLVRNGFRDFFSAHVNKYKKYKDLPMGAIGSIAFLYKDLLGEVAKENGFTVEKIIRSPLDELVQYHNQLQKVDQ
jgi:N-acetylglucosamine kinase-like BadF-type ATPase